ncbi:MAG: VWA domain-containing protein [Ardenticatenaceae bacterium]|nr:VWA domain-containing protein [Ardenticatenaceae bacterium]
MKIKRFAIVWLLLLSLLIYLAACGGSVVPTAEEPAAEAPTAAEAPAEEVVEVTRVVTEAVEAPAAEEAAVEEEAAAVEEAAEVVDLGQEATGSERGGDQIEPPSNGPKVDAPRQQTAVLATTNTTDQPRAETEPPPAPLPAANVNPLTAGEIDDNAQWAAYLAYLASYTANDVVRLDVSQRHELVVVDGAERPLLGVELTIQANGQEITRLKTGSNGRSTFYPRPFNAQSPTYTVTATAADGSRQTITASGSETQWRVVIPNASQPAAAQLDVLLLLDATGSMADELDELKSNIRAIASQIAALPGRPNVQWSLVAYRDRDEPLVAQIAPFSTDLNTFAAALDGVEAAGGGDYAEDVQGALALALEQFAEQNGRQAVKLVFLVADAPPHLDYTDQPSYAELLPQAAALGVKIYPLASSGLDAQGAYIFRQWAQWTNGRFLFLTNDANGSTSAAPSVTSSGVAYTVGNLDTLILNIIRKELSGL